MSKLVASPLKGIGARPTLSLILATLVLLGLALSATAPATPTPRAPVDPAMLELIQDRGRIDETTSRRWARTIDAEARRHRLEPSLVLGLIAVESSFRPRARSRAGARGLMQIMPKTGRALARELGIPWRGTRTLVDPQANLRMGTAYLRWLLDRFDGRRDLALAAYCHGPARIRRLLRAGHVPGRRLRYARKVARAQAEVRAELAAHASGEVLTLTMGPSVAR